MLMTRMQEFVGKPIEDFLTIEEAVRLTGYTDQYLRRMANEGRVRAIKRGHFWLLERTSLTAYLRAAHQTSDRRFGPREEEQN